MCLCAHVACLLFRVSTQVHKPDSKRPQRLNWTALTERQKEECVADAVYLAMPSTKKDNQHKVFWAMCERATEGKEAKPYKYIKVGTQTHQGILLQLTYCITAKQKDWRVFWHIRTLCLCATSHTCIYHLSCPCMS